MDMEPICPDYTLGLYNCVVYFSGKYFWKHRPIRQLHPAGWRTCSNTSSAAPAHWPDSTASNRACSSMIPPRAQLTMRTPRLHFDNVSLLIKSANSITPCFINISRLHCQAWPKIIRLFRLCKIIMLPQQHLQVTCVNNVWKRLIETLWIKAYEYLVNIKILVC